MTIIKINEVKTHKVNNKNLLFHLKRPASGTKKDAYALQFHGEMELLDSRMKIGFLKVSGVAGDNNYVYPLKKFKEGRSTALLFNFSVNLLGFPLIFDLVLSVVMSDGSSIALATIKGSRQPVQSSFQPSIGPLMLTSIARTGTTMLMKVLSSHPDIVAQKVYPYETRAGSYWMQFLRILSAPYPEGNANIQDIMPQQFSLSPNTCYIPRLMNDARLNHLLGVQYVEDMAAFCQKSLEGYYLTVAQSQNQDKPVYFVEKYLPRYLNLLLWELYPKAKEFILVRDFRDMLCSMNAFNEKRGTLDFGRAKVDNDEDFILQLRSSISLLHQAWQTRRDRAYLLRYEDIVLKPAETIKSMLQYLDIDNSDRTINMMVAAANFEDAQTKGHRTAGTAEESVGRWKKDLSPSLQVVCEREFGHILDAFGYQR